MVKKNLFTQRGMSRREFIQTGAKVVGAAAMSGEAMLVPRRKAFAAEKIDMRMNVSDPRGYHCAEAMFYFADIVRKRTNGELDIKVFPAGSLGGYDVPGTEGCINGMWEFCTCTATNFSNFSNIFQATELPYLFLTLEETYKAADGEPGEIIAKGVEKVGLKLLNICNYGFRNYYNNVREVHSPAEMKGQKVRTSFSPLEIAIIKAQGGNPTPISGAEVITSLAQGVVDGVGNTDDYIYFSKWYEVLKYCTETKYMYSYTNLLMNIKVFNKLPKKFQNIIIEASREALIWQREQASAAVEKAWVAMNKKGIKKYVPTADDMKLFMRTTQSVWDEYLKPGKAEPELVDRILKVIGRTKKEIFN